MQTPDGTIAYTRDGSFHTDPQGRLVTTRGFPLVPAITSPQNVTGMTIGQDGSVPIKQGNSSNTRNIATLQLATFINPVSLDSIGQNLFQETQSSGAPNVGQLDLNGIGSRCHLSAVNSSAGRFDVFRYHQNNLEH